ncbi:MAG: hypothetical protein KAW56_08950 [Candidatus Marinimicrobia bacterium]|nr:hypothetical protein [Candidatus Neomarinimicrobiota bacterium]MCK4447197.1 hypothetical protein [Candidatus Neomarinimicrobiota bacterium]
MKDCRHRHRDDRHRIAAPTNRRLPGASLLMSHGVGVLNIADNVCPRLPDICRGDCQKSRIGSLRLSAIK